MGLWSMITGSDKAVDTGLDLIKQGANGIDALFYTDEEKAQASERKMELKYKTGELYNKFIESNNDENSIRSKARRQMAWLVMRLAVFLTLYGVFSYTLYAVFDITGFNKVAVYCLDMLKVWWPIVFAVAGFYFGAHLVRARMEKSAVQQLEMQKMIQKTRMEVK